ncbi:MAG: hypothetical protein IJR77_05270 [Bacteroidales bacterium]|nr:hypothetical protein [Bacteroidales bacterium]
MQRVTYTKLAAAFDSNAASGSSLRRIHRLYGFAMEAYRDENLQALDKANEVEEEIDDYTRRYDQYGKINQITENK